MERKSSTARNVAAAGGTAWNWRDPRNSGPRRCRTGQARMASTERSDLSGRARRFASARQLVPADRGSDRFLQIGAGLPGLDQYRPQPGQKTDLVIDRPRIADQDILLANFCAAKNAA